MIACILFAIVTCYVVSFKTYQLGPGQSCLYIVLTLKVSRLHGIFIDIFQK